MALGLTLGIILAVSSGNTTKIAQSAGVASVSPSASASASGAGASVPASVAPSTPAAGAAAQASTAQANAAQANAAQANTGAVANAAIPAVNPAGRAGLAGANAVDAAGNPFSFNQKNADQALASMNCTVAVPANPLTAQGLARPWVLGDGCTWANGGTEGVFVDATILAPNGQLQVYDPLVINQGTTPAVAPTPPTIARGSQVILSVGFNGNALALVGTGARQGNCIDAFGNSLINQTPQCNAANFYRLANAEIARGTLTVPAVGTGQDGQACPTTRDFGLIDQDQSDNAVAHYLFDPATGQSAQDTANNQVAMGAATVEANGSDNGLLDGFVDPALGCKPFTAPNPTNPNGASASQALNELSARVNQKGTVALLPVNDPQLLVGGQFSIGKTNTYRMETDQPLLPFNTNTSRNAATYCQNIVNIQTARLQLDAGMEMQPNSSPVPTLGNTLANFLAARESASFGNLNCGNFGLVNPVTLQLNGAVAIGAAFNTAQQTAKVTATTTGARAGRGGGGAGNRGNFMPGRRGHV